MAVDLTRLRAWLNSTKLQVSSAQDFNRAALYQTIKMLIDQVDALQRNINAEIAEIGSSTAASITGPIGPSGIDGIDGSDGDIGPPGVPGVIGPTGLQGLAGLMGPPGLDGADGEDSYLSLITTSTPSGSGTIDGSGTINRVAKFTAVTTIGDSSIFDDGTNVGINTLIPSAKLDVSGVIRSTALTSTPTTGAGIEIYYNPNSGFIKVYNYNTSIYESLRLDGGSIYFGINGVIKVAINFNGYLGVGTTIPELTAHIRGVAGLPAISGIDQIGIMRLGQISGMGVLDFGHNNSGGGWIQSTDRTDLSIEYPLLLNPNGGNVGIGTTGPGTKLDVLGRIRARSERLEASFSATSNSGSIVQLYHDGTSGILKSTFYSGSFSPLSFQTSDLDRLTILANGNVGIGTISPGLRAEVFGSNGNPAASGTTQTGILRLSESGGTGVLDFGNNEAAAAWIQSTRSGDLSVGRMLALNPNGGNVGIGTTSPQNTFVVSNGGAAGLEFIPASGAILSYNRSGAAYVPFAIAASTLSFSISGAAAALFINASNNVGIGTLTPTAATLQLVDSGTFGWSDIIFSRAAANRVKLASGDVFNLAPTALASLPAGADGDIACVSNSAVTSWGATISAGTPGTSVIARFRASEGVWKVMGF